MCEFNWPAILGGLEPYCVACNDQGECEFCNAPSKTSKWTPKVGDLVISSRAGDWNYHDTPQDGAEYLGPIYRVVDWLKTTNGVTLTLVVHDAPHHRYEGVSLSIVQPYKPQYEWGDGVYTCLICGADIDDETGHCARGCVYNDEHLPPPLEREDDPDPGWSDGDHETGLASAGFGTDEDYGYYGGDDYPF